MSDLLIPESGQRRRPAPIHTEPTLLWVVVAWTGLAVAIVGWTDIALLWFPLQFGSPEWEFATTSRHFDAMPLGTLGLCLAIAGSIGRGWRAITRGLAGFCGVMAVVLLMVLALFLLDVPLALKGFAPAARPAVLKAVVKAGIFAVTYTTLYASLGWFLWRKTAQIKS